MKLASIAKALGIAIVGAFLFNKFIAPRLSK